jgi:hypothetical protein
VSIGVGGQQKATAVRTTLRAYPLVTTEVAAQTGEAPRLGEDDSSMVLSHEQRST